MTNALMFVAQRATAMVLLAALAACGGGGGSSESTQVAAPTNTGSTSVPGGTGSSGTPTTSSGGSADASSNPTAPPVAANSSSSSAPGNHIVFPLEVLGDGKQATVTEVKMAIDTSKLAQASQLWFKCHRCGFYGAPEYEATTVPPATIKASMRILGGNDPTQDAKVPWVDITDANLKLPDDERIHGGVNGGLYTARMALPLDATTRARLVGLPGLNRVQFRFNGTDGESNGFRVLALQLQDSNGTALGSDVIDNFDPQTERKVGSVQSADAKAGESLWYGEGSLLRSSISPSKINASCSDCHAAHGTDLQFFNYSNNAITQRAMYHGLSALQGKQIAAFLRYSLQSEKYEPKARPWNPPYQPGAGLDCHGLGCETVWEAGAGLDAVLSSPKQAVNALFGKDINATLALTQADVDRVMDPNATMNTREMPVPLQFPDWNAWLPAVHPMDIWPKGQSAMGSFVDGATFSAPGSSRKDPLGKYKALIAWLDAHKNPNGAFADWSHLTPDQRVQIMQMFNLFGWESYNYLGGGRGNHIASSGQFGVQVGAAYLQQHAASATTSRSNPAWFTSNSFIERAESSLLHWNTVKQWELAHTYGLLGNQKWFIGAKDASTGAWKGRGEAHGWPFNTVGPFYLAPHMLYQADTDSTGAITRQWYQAWESNNIVASYYHTNQWYQMQLSLNPGGQSGFSNYPIDWGYLLAFDHYLAAKVGTATPAAQTASNEHYTRQLQALAKLAQYLNNDIPLYDPTQPDLVANAGRYGRANGMKDLTVVNFIDTAYMSSYNFPSPFRFMDTLQPGLYLKTVNGAIAQFNTLYTSTDPAAWRRCDPNNTMLGGPENLSGFRFCLDTAKTPLLTRPNGALAMPNDIPHTTYEQTEQYAVWNAQQLGAEPVRMKKWTDWLARVWP